MSYTTIFVQAFVLVGSLLFSSCGNDDPATPENPSFRGEFVSAIHTTNGIASIDQDKTTLFLSDFKTDSGPDLNIYFTTNPGNVTFNFIDLGDIKGVNGDYTYDLPANTDFTVYKYVVVWCVDFDVNFGYAELEEQ